MHGMTSDTGKSFFSSQGHKKEIREREETVVDKDKRIYDLRKKNQELEKFKFVLNYKIQELKRQIMPRKKEIQVGRGCACKHSTLWSLVLYRQYQSGCIHMPAMPLSELNNT
jgi:hypothetical protein